VLGLNASGSIPVDRVAEIQQGLSSAYAISPLAFAPLVLTFALSVAALTAVPGFLGVLAVSAVVGLSIHAVFPVLDAYVLGALPDDTRASAYALFSGVALALEAPGSAAVGAAATRASLGTTFLVFSLALVPVVAVLGAAYLLGRFPASRADVAA